MALNVAAQVTDRCKVALEKRLSMVKGGKSHLGMAKWSVEALFADVVQTVPIDQIESYRRNIRGCTYTIGVKSPGGYKTHDPDYGVWVDFVKLDALKEACKDHCLTCDKDRADRRSCALRKALGAISLDEDKPEKTAHGDCPWWGGI